MAPLINAEIRLVMEKRREASSQRASGWLALRMPRRYRAAKEGPGGEEQLQ
jgi:hypothetical protein